MARLQVTLENRPQLQLGGRRQSAEHCWVTRLRARPWLRSWNANPRVSPRFVRDFPEFERPPPGVREVRPGLRDGNEPLVAARWERSWAASLRTYGIPGPVQATRAATAHRMIDALTPTTPCSCASRRTLSFCGRWCAPNSAREAAEIWSAACSTGEEPTRSHLPAGELGAEAASRIRIVAPTFPRACWRREARVYAAERFEGFPGLDVQVLPAREKQRWLYGQGALRRLWIPQST